LARHIARLNGSDEEDHARVAETLGNIPGVSRPVVHEVLDLVHAPFIARDDARRLYPDYLESVERLVEYLDGWKQTRTA
jgi:hypothetical protein